MSRYIDADKLMLELNDWWYSQTKIESQNIPYDDYISITIRSAMEAVKEQQTADFRENVRGEWLHDEVTMNGNTVYTPNAKCSICDCYVFQESDFCPNCGADMRGDK